METGKSATDILKLAILLERKGKAFYTQVARQTESKAVKQVFETMAEEEDAHINFLSKQFKHYEENKTFLKNELQIDADHAETDEILSAQVKKEISAASFEAAAISAAIEFENKAIEVYSDRAQKATDTNEKEMYQLLADWEKTHHKLLFRMNEDLKQEIWNDNNFWPF